MRDLDNRNNWNQFLSIVALLLFVFYLGSYMVYITTYIVSFIVLYLAEMFKSDQVGNAFNGKSYLSNPVNCSTKEDKCAIAYELIINNRWYCSSCGKLHKADEIKCSWCGMKSVQHK